MESTNCSSESGLKIPGSATQISVSQDFRVPWIINHLGQIFKATKDANWFAGQGLYIALPRSIYRVPQCKEWAPSVLAHAPALTVQRGKVRSLARKDTTAG